MLQYVQAYYLSCLKFFVSILLIFIARIIWKRFISTNIEANCWFCNKYSLILRKDKNNFFCVHCDQYNGFNDDGDYNCNINEEVSDSILSSYPKKVVDNLNYFCRSCENIQNYKLKLFSNFIPTKEENFEVEFSEYKNRVEKVYGLCNDCERQVSKRINKINNVVLPDYIKWKVASKPQSNYRFVLHLSNLIILSILVLMFLVYLNHKSYSKMIIPNYKEFLLIGLFLVMVVANMISQNLSFFRISSMHLVILFMLIGYDHIIVRFKYEKFFYRLPLLFFVCISIMTVIFKYFLLFYNNYVQKPMSAQAAIQTPVLLTKNYSIPEQVRPPSYPSSVCSSNSNYFSSPSVEPDRRSVFSAPHYSRTSVPFRSSLLNYVNVSNGYQPSSVGANANCNVSIQDLRISSPHRLSDGSLDQFDSVSQHSSAFYRQSNYRPTLSRISQTSGRSFKSLKSSASIGTPVKHDSNLVAFIKFSLSALAVQVIFYLFQTYLR